MKVTYLQKYPPEDEKKDWKGWIDKQAYEAIRVQYEQAEEMLRALQVVYAAPFQGYQGFNWGRNPVNG